MRKLVLFAIPFGIAALLYVYLLSASAGLIFGGAAAVCCLVLSLLRFPKKKMYAILAAGLAAGFLWSAGYELLFLQPAWALDGEQREISLTVCDYPSKTAYGCKLKTELLVGGRRAKVLLYLNGEIPELAPGDTLLVTAKLHKTDPSEDDGDYFSLSSGYALRASGRNAVSTACGKTPLRFYPAVLAQKLRNSLAEAVPEDAVGFLQALTTGNRNGLPEETLNEISDAGFSHVIAVSGMHVSILLGVIYFLTRRSPLLSALLGIPLMLLFAVMTGGSPSVIRACVMQLLLLIAPLLHRDTDWPTTVCTAMLVILLANPNAAASVSFQLSFGAIVGIFLCSERLYSFFSRPTFMQKMLENRLVRVPLFFILSCTATTLGAMLFSVPLIALHFGRVGIYSLLSNLLVLWVISLCFSGGLIVGILGMLLPVLAKPLGWLLAWPVRYILLIARLVSVLPFARLSAETPYVALWLVFSYLFLLLALLQKGHKPFLLAGICILGSAAAALMLTQLDAKFSDFRIAVLDVGQGECVCMQAKEFTAMVDCGGSSGYTAAITARNYLQECADGHLDCLLLTHYDCDHVNGAERLLQTVQVDKLYLPDVADETGTRSTIEAAAAAAGTEIVYVTQNTTVSFHGGTMRMFAPVSYYNDNAASLSVLFSASEYDMLITGDMDIYAEYDLLLKRTLPQVDLFIAGHHGSAGSSSAELLTQIKPKTVIISVGEYNNYGHPSAETLQRFSAVGATVYCTDECGTVVISK